MFSPVTFLSKDAKLKNAEKIKEDKRRWKEEKLQREREASEALKKKNQELNNLEQSFLDELSKRKQKKEEEKVERFFYVKKKKVGIPNFSPRGVGHYALQDSDLDNIDSSSVFPSASNVLNSQNSRNYNKHVRSDDDSQGNYSNKVTTGYSSTPYSDLEKHKDLASQNSPTIASNLDLMNQSGSSSPSNRFNSKSGVNFAGKFNSNLKFLHPTASDDLSANEASVKSEGLGSNMRQRKRVIDKRQKKFLPLILKPISNGMLTVHIVGENSHTKALSQNSTPIRGEDETRHSPYFHMFRDVEIINKSSNVLPVSKVKAMRDYDKEVKRFHTPKPDINYNLRLEHKKLEKYLENTVKRIKFFKIFK